MHVFKHQLTYLSVPKCACTSLKLFLFEVENDFRFRRFKVNRKTYGIHNLVRSIPFGKLPQERITGHHKIAVVRHPVGRIVSCYESKILSGGQHQVKGIDETEFLDAGLPLLPSLAEFVDRLEAYQKASKMILQHSRPLSYFLGQDPGWFDRIYGMFEIEQLNDDVRRRTETNAAVEKRNAAKVKADPSEITPEVIAKINHRYASDHTIFGRWFEPNVAN